MEGCSLIPFSTVFPLFFFRDTTRPLPKSSPPSKLPISLFFPVSRWVLSPRPLITFLFLFWVRAFLDGEVLTFFLSFRVLGTFFSRPGSTFRLSSCASVPLVNPGFRFLGRSWPLPINISYPLCWVFRFSGWLFFRFGGDGPPPLVQPFPPFFLWPRFLIGCPLFSREGGSLGWLWGDPRFPHMLNPCFRSFLFGGFLFRVPPPLSGILLRSLPPFCCPSFPIPVPLPAGFTHPFGGCFRMCRALFLPGLLLFVSAPFRSSPQPMYVFGVGGNLWSEVVTSSLAPPRFPPHFFSFHPPPREDPNSDRTVPFPVAFSFFFFPRWWCASPQAASVTGFFFRVGAEVRFRPSVLR